MTESQTDGCSGLAYLKLSISKCAFKVCYIIAITGWSYFYSIREILKIIFVSSISFIAWQLLFFILSTCFSKVFRAKHSSILTFQRFKKSNLSLYILFTYIHCFYVLYKLHIFIQHWKPKDDYEDRQQIIIWLTMNIIMKVIIKNNNISKILIIITKTNI